MAKTQRKRYSPKFKFQVVLEALRQRTLPEKTCLFLPARAETVFRSCGDCLRGFQT